MKSQRGVTLTSLVIYIVVVLIVLGILATIRTNFQSNLKQINKEGTSNSEIDKFNIYFLKEVKKQGNDIEKIDNTEITFITGNKYSFRDNIIYLNGNIKIAENIDKCVFRSELQNGKTVITVEIKASNSEEKIIEYVLSNQTNSNSYEDETKYVYEIDNSNTMQNEIVDSNNI